jgi:hypothetical protein
MPSQTKKYPTSIIYGKSIGRKNELNIDLSGANEGVCGGI